MCWFQPILVDLSLSRNMLLGQDAIACRTSAIKLVRDLTRIGLFIYALANVLTVQLAYKGQLILRHVSIYACAFTYRLPKTVHWKCKVESDQQQAGVLYTLHERRNGCLNEQHFSLRRHRNSVIHTYENAKIENNAQHILCLGQLDRFPYAQTLLIRSCLIQPVGAPAGYVTERAVEDGKVGLLELYCHTYLRNDFSGRSPVAAALSNLLLSGNWKR